MNNQALELKSLVGQRVVLHPLTRGHYEALRSIANDERIWAYMPVKAYGEFFEEWFEDCLSKHDHRVQITYVIQQLRDKRIIGCRSYYDIDTVHKRLEVGNGWFTPAVWGAGFHHESFSLLFKNVFEDWQFNRIQIGTDPRNHRSYHVLKKLGASEEGLLRQHMVHHNGLITDTVVFSIIAQEWPAIKERLELQLNFYSDCLEIGNSPVS